VESITRSKRSTGRRGAVLDGREDGPRRPVLGCREEGRMQFPALASETSLPPDPESVLRKELGVR